jgi:hypothetical protein
VKKLFLLFYIQAFFGTAGYAENPRWQAYGTPINAASNLVVHWNVSLQTIPAKVWVYESSPNVFSSKIIANLLKLCSLEDTNRPRETVNGLSFQSPDKSRSFSASFADGKIRYETAEHSYGPTNLAVGVPGTNLMPRLTLNFVKKAGLSLADITGYFGTNKIEFSEFGTMYYTDDSVVTNMVYRVGYFRRAVDNIPVIGSDGGSIYYGEQGKVNKLTLTWQNWKRSKAYPTISKTAVVDFFHQGKMRQGLLPDSIGEIDWATVKTVTIKNALPFYFAGDSRWLYPFLVLTASVETSRGSFEVQVECPIFDETKL